MDEGASAGTGPGFIPFGGSSLDPDPGQFGWHPRLRDYSRDYLAPPHYRCSQPMLNRAAHGAP